MFIFIIKAEIHEAPRRVICAFCLNAMGLNSLKYSASMIFAMMIMTLEKSALISLLKLTRTGPVSRPFFTKAARIPEDAAKKALAKFAHMSLFDEHGDIIEASPRQRVRMSVYALTLGSDVERVCKLLSWAEFEMIAGQAFETNDYRVVRNLHFTQGTTRWEIDVLGIRKPLIICVDCKHWRRGWRSAATARTVEAQVKRTEALAEVLPRDVHKIGLESWHKATLVPLVLSLLPGPHRFYNAVPVVPILQLQDFISEVDVELNSLHHIDRKIEQGSVRIDRTL